MLIDNNLNYRVLDSTSKTLAPAGETCFAVNDGYIDVSAKGEVVRTFLYQLTKEEVVQFYNGTNWVDYSGTKANDETWFPFISKNNTKIGNLAKGNYRVKVKDSKGCFAR